MCLIAKQLGAGKLIGIKRQQSKLKKTLPTNNNDHRFEAFILYMLLLVCFL